MKIRRLVMDAGERKNILKIFDSATRKIAEVSFTEFRDLPLSSELNGVSHGEYDRVHIISEGAHLVPRKRSSLAQILERNILQALVDNCASDQKWKLLAFPEKCTPRALTKYGLDKDTGDVEAICRFVEDHPNFSLKHVTNLDTPDDVKDGLKWRDAETNPDMNAAQVHNYGCIKKGGFELDLELVPNVKNIILKNYEDMYNSVSQDTRNAFQLHDINCVDKKSLVNEPEWLPEVADEYRKFLVVGVQKKQKIGGVFVKIDPFVKSLDWSFSMRGVYAVLNGLVDYDGNIRRVPVYHPDGVSNNWIHRFYFVDSPRHQKGGVGRAILMNYVFPEYVSSEWKKSNSNDWHSWHKAPKNRGKLTDEQNEFFDHHMKLFRKAKKELLNYFRSVI